MITFVTISLMRTVWRTQHDTKGTNVQTLKSIRRDLGQLLHRYMDCLSYTFASACLETSTEVTNKAKEAALVAFDVIPVSCLFCRDAGLRSLSPLLLKHCIATSLVVVIVFKGRLARKPSMMFVASNHTRQPKSNIFPFPNINIRVDVPAPLLHLSRTYNNRLRFLYGLACSITLTRWIHPSMHLSIIIIIIKSSSCWQQS